MLHAPGWCLGTVVVSYQNLLSSDTFKTVLHYDFGGVSAAYANAQQVVVGLEPLITGSMGLIMGSNTKAYLLECVLNDGTYEANGAVELNEVGLRAGTMLPQQVCSIVRKQAVATGRRRFGHICMPGVSTDMCSDANNLTTTLATLQGEYWSGWINAATNIGFVFANMVLYSPSTDQRNNVDRIYGTKPLRTNRHRTAGRGE